jgi:hypothetical protein
MLNSRMGQDLSAWKSGLAGVRGVSSDDRIPGHRGKDGMQPNIAVD